MPVPHLEIRIVQRSKGSSAVAGAAYQAGEKLFSEYDQKSKDHRRKQHEVVYTEIMLPSHAPPEYADRAMLWNSAEEVEKQWNSQLARRFVVALPREVPLEMCPQMLQEYCREYFVSKGMCCDFAIHDPDPPGHNPHCHIMLTMRAIDENGKWMPKSRKVYDLDENGERIKLPSGRWKSHKEDNRTHSVPDRIGSVSQPFVRPIVRGKAGKPVEFGAKLDISAVDGWTRLECCSFDAYNEAGNLQEMAERFRKREGHYPSRILADKIYRNRENLNYCKEHGIRLSGPALGRPRKGETRDKAQDYRDECERVEVERKFSLAKRKCGMGLVTAKLRETAAHVIAMSVLVLNLHKIQCALLRLFTYLVAVFSPKKKWTIVQ